MLQDQLELYSESIECIRVDGASDEGLSHEEVQYWWTERHLALAKGLPQGAVLVATSIKWSCRMAV